MNDQRIARELLSVARQVVAGKGDLDGRTLDQLVEMAGESSDIENWKGMEATPEVLREARKFDRAVKTALSQWASNALFRLAEDVEWTDLYDDDGSYNILMTLRGEGVGIWDGRWDKFFVDDGDIKGLEKYLKSKLGKFADSTGSGSLNEAFMNAAFEQAEEATTASEREVPRMAASRGTLDSYRDTVILRKMTGGGTLKQLAQEIKTVESAFLGDVAQVVAEQPQEFQDSVTVQPREARLESFARGMLIEIRVNLNTKQEIWPIFGAMKKRGYRLK